MKKIAEVKGTMRIVETWKPVKGFEGLYEVSNLGRIRSLDRVVDTVDGSSRRLKGSLMSINVDKGGYPLMRLGQDGVSKSKHLHKIVAEAFLGHTPSGLKTVVDHINGDKTDNRVANLQLVTQRENLSRIGGSSKYVGVNFYKATNKWAASITIEGKKYHLGYFSDEIDAANAYQEVLADMELFLAEKGCKKDAA